MRGYRLLIGLLVGAMSVLLMGFNPSPRIPSCPMGTMWDFTLKKCVPI